MYTIGNTNYVIITILYININYNHTLKFFLHKTHTNYVLCINCILCNDQMFGSYEVQHVNCVRAKHLVIREL